MSGSAILCVDDEKFVLESVKGQLRSAFGNAYLYETAEDAEEALELIDELREEKISVIVIVSDWLMPGMKGDEFLILVHQRFPNIIKIMLTGQADEAAISRTIDRANLHTCLYKPWLEKELIETIKSALSNIG